MTVTSDSPTFCKLAIAAPPSVAPLPMNVQVSTVKALSIPVFACTEIAPPA